MKKLLVGLRRFTTVQSVLFQGSHERCCDHWPERRTGIPSAPQLRPAGTGHQWCLVVRGSKPCVTDRIQPDQHSADPSDAGEAGSELFGSHVSRQVGGSHSQVGKHDEQHGVGCEPGSDSVVRAPSERGIYHSRTLGSPGSEGPTEVCPVPLRGHASGRGSRDASKRVLSEQELIPFSFDSQRRTEKQLLNEWNFASMLAKVKKRKICVLLAREYWYEVDNAHLFRL